METAIFIGWRECFRKPEEAGKSTGKIWTPEGINARRAVRISDWIAQAGTAEKGCGGIAVKKIHRTGKGRCQKKVIQQLYAQVEAESSKHAVSDLCRIQNRFAFSFSLLAAWWSIRRYCSDYLLFQLSPSLAFPRQKAACPLSFGTDGLTPRLFLSTISWLLHPLWKRAGFLFSPY